MEGYAYLCDPDGTFTPLPPCSPLSPCSPYEQSAFRLPAWNQVAQRAYIQVALCFPFDGEEATAVAHIKSSLKRFSQQRRDFAAGLRAHPEGEHVQLEKHHDDEVSFRVVDHGDKFPYTFEQLKSKDFAPSAFVNSDFGLDGTLQPLRLVPICQVRASFIEGGLILWVYLHHTFTDGDGLRMFLECFSAQTRGEEVDFPVSATDFEPADYTASLSSSPSSTMEDLLKVCPEYVRAPSPQVAAREIPSPAMLGTPLAHTIPWDPFISHEPNKGNLFIFRNDRLDLLRDLIETVQPAGQKKRPSTYVALAALTWAHLYKARVENESEAADVDPSSLVRLTSCVNWKNRACRDASKRYLGVGVALPFSELTAEAVLEPCDNFNAIVPLVRAIEDTIKSVDDKFVAQRTAALGAAVAEDARSVVLDFDYLNPKHIAFNTWRHIGMDTEWAIPGITNAKPEAIRPVRDVVTMGYALIMPAKRDSEVHELIITAAPKTMEHLMKNKDYTLWVDRVVE